MKNIIIVGVGGQGVTKASDILADAAFRAGFDVKKSELHGMSQRGGSVSSEVRYGERVLSPMVSVGEADVLIALDESQANAYRYMLRENGLLIAPRDVAAKDKKTINVASLGAALTVLGFSKKLLIDAIRANLPEKTHSLNEQALERGRLMSRWLIDF